MGKGYMGKVLWVDLTKGEIREEAIPEDYYRKFLTGYGLAAKLLYDRIPPGADPMGPENILAFMSGVLTGTAASFSGRFEVACKSPLTGGWGDANCGGKLSPAIKWSGYDGIFFSGISPKPVYLLVNNGKAELKDASGVWGQDAIETEKSILKLHEDLKRLQIACIGPAAEKLSLIAGISNDGGRFAARSGVGAVMGSKRLKAIAVTGKALVQVADKETLKTNNNKFVKALDKADIMQKIFSSWLVGFLGKLTRINPMAMANPGDFWCQCLKKYGTAGVTAMSAESGDSPVKNWGGVGFLDFPLSKSSKVSDDAVIKHQKERYGCFSCPVRCGGIVEMKEGPWPVEEMHKPEYESLCAFGALMLIDDIRAVFKLNDLCNRGGLDSISAGGVVAFAIECFENGILTKDDFGGLEPGWGKAEEAIKLLEMVIERRGIGDVLADGVKRAAERIGKGSERFAVHAGGQELPMHDGKFDTPQNMAYEVEPTPGRHTITSLTWQELILMDRYDKRADKVKPMMSKKARFAAAGKAKNNAINSRLMQIVNSSGLCLFGLACGPKYPLFEHLNAATGFNLSDEEWMTTGERIETLRHAFNVREGITWKQTRASGRATGNPPMGKGPHASATIDTETLARDFYKEMGWDFATGKPERDRLEKLGLDEVIKDIYG